jgi:hypothetical protein
LLQTRGLSGVLLFDSREQKCLASLINSSAAVVFFLAVLANATLAGTAELTDAEMDQITAGDVQIFDLSNNTNTIINIFNVKYTRTSDR